MVDGWLRGVVGAQKKAGGEAGRQASKQRGEGGQGAGGKADGRTLPGKMRIWMGGMLLRFFLFVCVAWCVCVCVGGVGCEKKEKIQTGRERRAPLSPQKRRDAHTGEAGGRL